ncbi:MAG TPA: hypothetical protein DC063_01435, partial [Arenimonas sp.]|nr:hypothetical protein [Arenimonas sp.]
PAPVASAPGQQSLIPAEPEPQTPAAPVNPFIRTQPAVFDAPPSDAEVRAAQAAEPAPPAPDWTLAEPGQPPQPGKQD